MKHTKRMMMLIVALMLLIAGSAQANLTYEEYRNACDMANLSARVYDNLWDSAWDTVSPLFFPDLDFVANTDHYVLIQEYVDNWGFDAKLYYNTENGGYVLAFRGTEAMSPLDWISDITQILNDYISADISQYRAAVDLAALLKNQLGNNLQITGHSLGGGLAQASALYTGLKATCFEAAGVTRGTLQDLGISDAMISQNSADITHFNVQYDPLSDFDGRMNNEAPFYNTLQYGSATYWLDNLAGTGGAWNPFRVMNHFYHTFVCKLQWGDFL